MSFRVREIAVVLLASCIVPSLSTTASATGTKSVQIVINNYYRDKVQIFSSGLVQLLVQLIAFSSFTFEPPLEQECRVEVYIVTYKVSVRSNYVCGMDEIPYKPGVCLLKCTATNGTKTEFPSKWISLPSEGCNKCWVSKPFIFAC